MKEGEGFIEGVWNEFVRWIRLFIIAATQSSVHQVPLDNTPMVTADDFLLFELVLVVELELGAELDDVELTVSRPEISKEKKRHVVSPTSRQSAAKTNVA